MLLEEQRMRGRVGGWAGLGLAVVAATALGSLAGARVSVTNLERARSIQDGREVPLAQRLAAVDAALAENDRGRAVYEWRNAYGLALGTRRWEAMVTVGDAALKIDALASRLARHPTGFRAEARQAYLVALFRARDARAPEGVERVAEAFAALGDAEMAARVRTILVKAAR